MCRVGWECRSQQEAGKKQEKKQRNKLAFSLMKSLEFSCLKQRADFDRQKKNPMERSVS